MSVKKPPLLGLFLAPFLILGGLFFSAATVDLLAFLSRNNAECNYFTICAKGAGGNVQELCAVIMSIIDWIKS